MSEEDKYPEQLPDELHASQLSPGERKLLELSDEPIYRPTEKDLEELIKNSSSYRSSDWDESELDLQEEYDQELAIGRLNEPIVNDFSDLNEATSNEDFFNYMSYLEHTLAKWDATVLNVRMRRQIKHFKDLVKAKEIETSATKKRQLHDPHFGRMPPQDLEAEKIALGLLIKYPELRENISEPYFNKMLHSVGHANAHKVMMDLGPKADISSISHELMKRHQLDDFGGEGMIETYVAWAEDANPKNLDHYLHLIEDTYLAREAVKYINEAGENFWNFGKPEPDFNSKKLSKFSKKKVDARKSEEEPKDIVELIRNFHKGLLEILPFRYQRNTTPEGLVKVVSDEFEELKARNGRPEVSTGYSKLDRVTHGIRGNKLVVLGARTKQGKTTMETNLMKNVAEQGKHVLFFTYENSPKEIIKKLWANYSGVNSEVFDYYEDLKRTDEEALERAKDSVRNLPITIESGTPNIDYVTQMINYTKLKDPSLSLVVVDGLQSFAGHVPYQGNKTDIYYEILKKLKGSAEEQDLTVMISSQLKQDVEKRKNKKPFKIDDFSDCKGLSEVADTAFFLYRPEFYWPDNADYKNWMSVIPVAMRTGEPADKQFKLGCDMKTSRIYELPKNSVNFK